MSRKTISEALLNRLVSKMVDNNKIFSAVLRVEQGDGNFSWAGAAGGMKKESRFFIASVTKLYITAVMMQLIEASQITLQDKISKHLPESIWRRIHILNGVDYSGELTLYHLISNTSGIPDYFFYKQADGKTSADDLMEGNDESWPLEKTIELVKKLRPNFKPGTNVRYSDTNYQLLGRIIEVVTGKSIDNVFDEYIFSELQLKNTYVYRDVNDQTPVPFYYQSRPLWLPQYIAAVGPEGGIVSTADELMLFLKAFFSGRFFPKEKINDLKKWRLMFPPPGLFYFGIGLEKLWIPWIISPFNPIKDVLGFWGQTGSFAFYNPQSDVYLCGTTNQIDGAGHRAAGSAMLKIIKSVL